MAEQFPALTGHDSVDEKTSKATNPESGNRVESQWRPPSVKGETTMKSSLRLAPALVLVLSLPLALAGCGSNTGDRALTGAGIGAATGASIGAITPLSILPATLIGAGVGAAIGGLTSADEIDLGKPLWD
jgi:hypothetical protein